MRASIEQEIVVGVFPRHGHTPRLREDRPMELLEQISQCLQRGDDAQVAALTQEAINAGIDAKEILDDGLIAGMNVIGERFRNHEIFLPDVLLAARAMCAGTDLLEPLFLKDEVPKAGKVVLGTVKGDLHDIGKNLVGIMLQGAGFEIVDLGKDVAPEAFVDTAVDRGARVIGISTLLTTTVPMMREVVELVRKRSPDGQIKTIVGGAPLSQDLADEIGADAYGYDGANAVVRVKELVAASRDSGEGG